jgi:hypothetical protein
VEAAQRAPGGAGFIAPLPAERVLTWGVISSSARSCSTWSQRCCRASGRVGYTRDQHSETSQNPMLHPCHPQPHLESHLTKSGGGRPGVSRRSVRRHRCLAQTHGPAGFSFHRRVPPGKGASIWAKGAQILCTHPPPQSPPSVAPCFAGSGNDRSPHRSSTCRQRCCW